VRQCKLQNIGDIPVKATLLIQFSRSGDRLFSRAIGGFRPPTIRRHGTTHRCCCKSTDAGGVALRFPSKSSARRDRDTERQETKQRKRRKYKKWRGRGSAEDCRCGAQDAGRLRDGLRQQGNALRAASEKSGATQRSSADTECASCGPIVNRERVDSRRRRHGQARGGAGRGRAWREEHVRGGAQCCVACSRSDGVDHGAGSTDFVERNNGRR